MWNAMARRKNSYLHSTLGANLDPIRLNRCVNLALSDFDNWHINPEMGFHQPTVRHPKIYAPKVLKHHANVAYGRRGIPKLICQMSSKFSLTRSRAFRSLIDELKDPIKYYRAVIEFDIARKINEVIEDFFPIVENSDDLEMLLDIIVILASHHKGAKSLVDEHQLISNLFDMIIDGGNISRTSAKALYMMSCQPEVADIMANADHLHRVLQVLRRVEIIQEAFMLMANLIERSPGKGMDLGCFKYLYPRIRCRDDLQWIVVKCFGLLINCKEAEEDCDQVDLMKTLYTMLTDDTLPLNVIEYVILAIKNATVTTPSLWRCAQFWNLPVELIRRAHSKNSEQLQLWSLQALNNITAHPSLKSFVRKTCKKRIKNIQCKKKCLEQWKNQLLERIRKKPYINIEPNDDSPEAEIDDRICDQVETRIPNICGRESADEEELDEFDGFPREIAYRLDYKPLKKYP